MSIPGKLLIALLSAFAVSLVAGEVFNVLAMKALFAPTFAAAVLAVVLSHKPLPMPGSAPGSVSSSAASASAAVKPAQAGQNTANTRDSRRKASPAAKARDKRPEKQARKVADTSQAKQSTADPVQSAHSAELETGTVKWFNGSKGFGFLIREDGEEVFVHHRSIVGEGRRNLTDGAAVRFRVVTTDKGPQAEDVEPQD